MSLLHAVVLGIVQGLSEYLPISSSGHLILVPWLLGWPEENNLTFDVALHLGTALAVLVYFWRQWLALIQSVLRGLASPEERLSPEWRLAWMIVLGSIPAAVAGVILSSTIEDAIRQPWIVAALLIVFAVVLLYADRVPAHTRDLKRFTLREAIIVGCAQVLALFPGVSRSGITMTAGLLLGLTRDAAARFSFLLSMPVILGAAAFQLLKLMRSGGFHGEGLAFLVGIVAAAIVGLLTIGFLLGYVRRNSLDLFVGYRVIAGLAVLLLVILGH